MNETDKNSQISPETEKLISAETCDELEEVDRIDQMKKEHKKEMANMRETLNKTLDKLKEYANDSEKIINQANAKDREIVALQEALMKQKKMNTMTEKERYMSEGERIGMKTLEVIDKRLAERYGNSNNK